MESIDRLVEGRVVHQHELEDDGLTYRGQLAGCPVYGKTDQNYILRNLDYRLPKYYMLWMRFSEKNEEGEKNGNNLPARK